MRVAIYEPHPRIAGPVTWAGFLKKGFELLGIDCDLVSITRSGKPSKRWGPGTGRVNRGWSWSAMVPDRIGKDGTIFDEYDFVILTEPKSSPFDRWAQKQRGEKGRLSEEKLVLDAEPMYITWLRQTRTPWASALHGPQYQKMRAPFLEQLLSLENFTGHVMSTRREFADTAPAPGFEGVEVHEHRPLPYVPVHDIEDKVELHQRFAMSGRAVANKGPQLLAYAAAQGDLPAGWNVELHGAGAIGAGPAFTYRLYACLKALGCTGGLEGGDYAPNGKLRALKPERWKVQAPDGRWITYWGPYEDTVGTAERMGVHVNLTESKFSYGMIEFVGLEALDAGAIPVYPTHVLGAADYEVFELTKFVSPPPIRSEHNRPGSDYIATQLLVDGVYEELVEKLDAAANLALSPHRWDTILHNREIIRIAHDPSQLATRFMEECR